MTKNDWGVVQLMRRRVFLSGDWWATGLDGAGQGGTPDAAHALWAQRAELPVPVGPGVGA